MVWYFSGVYIINRTLHGRLEIRNFSSRVENYFTRRAPTEEKFRISARACNILYLPNSLNQFLKEMHGEFVCRYRFKRVK